MQPVPTHTPWNRFRRLDRGWARHYDRLLVPFGTGSSVMRVLVAAFSIEANSFAAGETTLDDFRAQTFAIGSEIHRDVVGAASELAGAWDVLDGSVEIVPAVVAQASPGAPVAADVV